jgi:hypothetical protein
MLDAGGNGNTIYMIYFPPGESITLQGFGSCVAGGFCAYHGTTSSLLNGKNILYGVYPDFQPPSGCSQGCGTSTTFGNYTSVSTHELAEAITDPDAEIAPPNAAPRAWYDQFNGEIGDICNGQQGSYTANGTAYTVQLLFSNSANNCVLPPPASIASVSPGSLPFGSWLQRDPPVSRTAILTNTGCCTINISSIGQNLTAPFSVTATNCGSTLGQGASCSITVTFTPGDASPGLNTDTLMIVDDAGNSPQTVSLSGTLRCPLGGCL